MRQFFARVANRLQFFPFTLVFLLRGLVLRLVELHSDRAKIHVGHGEPGGPELTRNVMLWLDRALRPAESPQDVCFYLSAQTASPGLHEAVSAALAFPHVRSLALYWDQRRAVEDLPLWQKRGLVRPHDLRGIVGEHLEEFRGARHAQFALPVTTVREAETFLKREAGSGLAVCLNLPPECEVAPTSLCRARPDVMFVDFRAVRDVSTLANHRPILRHGLTLHERMALVQAADAYIGVLDELGCCAIISGRPAVLLDGAATPHAEAIAHFLAALETEQLIPASGARR